ncbi:MAG: hypothetical protein AAF434_10575 [Pseudomonadota bacterium]
MPDSEIVGLVPAAGFASRLGKQSISKEILPVSNDDGGAIACDSLMNAFDACGCTASYWVIRETKTDIIDAIGNGARYKTPTHFISTQPTEGTPFTLDRAFEHVRSSVVVTGFPDILFSAPDPFSAMLKALQENHYDVVLGSFRTDRPEKMDVVDIDPNGRVTDIRIKQPALTPQYAWILATWTPVFSEFMHKYLQGEFSGASEIYVGTVLQAALDIGMPIGSVRFDGETCTDIGTPDDLEKLRSGQSQV